MATYERSVRVQAPFDEVWNFYSRARGLVELSPNWLHLHVEEIRGPDGEAEPDELVAGTRVHVSARPFGAGPRQRWISEIVERDEGDGQATFRDVMHDGPFPHWEHTHRFEDLGDATEVHDRVEYDLPGGPLGRAVSPFGVVGFEPMFAFRHRRTKALLEDG